MVGSPEYAELQIGTGEDTGMKQGKYFRLIKEKCEHLAFSPDIFIVRLGEGSAFSEMTTEKFSALNITLFKEGDNRLRLIKYSLKNTIFFYKLLKNSLLTSE